MVRVFFLVGLIGLVALVVWGVQEKKGEKLMVQNKTMQFNELTPEEERVIVHKGTEMPFTGKYYKHNDDGTYTCRRCNAPLYESTDKFESGCGWPSFDDAIPGAVKQVPDVDGRRTEIVCASCGGHLGHVFFGEGYTDKDTRFCVNSVSLDFVAEGTETIKQAMAYFAGGCFWGMEYFFEKADGVIDARSGFMGGDKKNPNYKEVCAGNTGHAEVIEVAYDPTKTNYETLARLFFEIHDPTQVNRQGPDVGYQYRSAIYYVNDEQKQVAERLIGILKEQGYKVVTEVTKADTFWVAEDYHQDYYEKNGHQPYCHGYTKRFPS
jgi:peptide methionine sulfoxide reductase msrA/msrB